MVVNLVPLRCWPPTCVRRAGWFRRGAGGAGAPGLICPTGCPRRSNCCGWCPLNVPVLRKDVGCTSWIPYPGRVDETGSFAAGPGAGGDILFPGVQSCARGLRVLIALVGSIAAGGAGGGLEKLPGTITLALAWVVGFASGCTSISTPGWEGGRSSVWTKEGEAAGAACIPLIDSPLGGGVVMRSFLKYPMVDDVHGNLLTLFFLVLRVDLVAAVSTSATDFFGALATCGFVGATGNASIAKFS